MIHNRMEDFQQSKAKTIQFTREEMRKRKSYKRSNSEQYLLEHSRRLTLKK